jgi:hypothetical protein
MLQWAAPPLQSERQPQLKTSPHTSRKKREEAKSAAPSVSTFRCMSQNSRIWALTISPTEVPFSRRSQLSMERRGVPANRAFAW